MPQISISAAAVNLAALRSARIKALDSSGLQIALASPGALKLSATKPDVPAWQTTDCMR